VLTDDGHGNWSAVSVGGDHTCALKTDGSAYCWGSNRDGQLGTAQSDTVCGSGTNLYPCTLVPRRVDTKLTFLSISAGLRHTCAIGSDHQAYCWGANDDGQVSDFAAGGPGIVQIQGTLPFSQISAGATHSCAVRSDGALFCWGSNDRGELGTSSSTDGMVRVFVGGAVAAVSAGQDRTCARTTNGAVSCWGATWFDRENGLEMTRSVFTPTPVPAATPMSSVSVGSFSTCGVDFQAHAYCWEANPRGELGDGSQVGTIVPHAVTGGLAFVQVSTGIVQTCGIATNGAGYCWGDDTFGQLGIHPSLLFERCGAQSLPCATTPIAVTGLQKFVDLSTGFGSHSCGVTTNGNLYCWGLGVSGQRGDGSEFGGIATPLRVVEPAG
jgi:alpha-tubulin suppressor-like RCC1 family protein